MKLVGDVIDEIAMEPFGSNIKVDCFVPTGVPVLNGSNLIGFVLNEDKFNYVTPEKAASLNKAVTSRGDVIVTHRGTLGQITYIPADSKYDKYVISQSQFRVRCKKDEMLPEFMVYFFHSREGQHQLLSNSSQVGVPALARPSSTFRKLKIPVPAIKEQRIIVDALTILNDKITSNKAINHHLEQIAQAIFKSWFVDFEPWGGIMPGNWRKGVLSDICTYSKNRVSISVLKMSTYISTENMQPNKAGYVDAGSLPTAIQTTSFKRGDVLVSNIRPYFKKIVFCDFDGGCSTDVLCFCPNEDVAPSFLFSILYDDSFFEYMLAGSKGTKMPRGDKAQIMQYSVVIPDENDFKRFENLVRPILLKVASNKAEFKRLGDLRDTLLPRLMSGELSVADVVSVK